MRNSFISLSLLILMFLATAIPYAYGGLEVCGYIDEVVDGDTVWAYLEDSLAEEYMNLTGSRVKIRFADINAPELDTVEGVKSKDALINLIAKYGNFICIDIDDVNIYDRYGRLVGVVYLDYNESHMLNLNLYMVQEGYAEFTDYPNEFTPSEFKLFIERDVPARDDSLPIPGIIILLVLVLIIYVAKRGRIGI